MRNHFRAKVLYMTVQDPEVIQLRGEARSMLSTPLCEFLRERALNVLFDDWAMSCLWRGYVGTWEVLDGRLYLVHLGGWLKDGTGASIQTVFPSSEGPIFADWFTGVLRIPDGELICEAVGGFDHQYERDIFLAVERGDIVREEMVHHEVVRPHRVKPSLEDRFPDD